MGYDGKVMKLALTRWEEEKSRRAMEFARRRREAYLREPEFKEIENQLRLTVSRVIAASLRSGSDPVPAVRMAQDENLDLQRRRAELLVAMGYPMDYLEEKPLCEKCSDTGYRGNRLCECLQKIYNREQLRELSSLLDLKDQSFERFSFDWYSTAVDPDVGMSPREQMERNFDICQDYAHQFGEHSENLLLSGDSGLGKTFLSACIAGVISESNHSVVYDTATHIFSQFENEHFRREDDEAASRDVKRYLNCDLLIMDDLGTEMTTAFVQSTLYQIVNGRLLNGKKTIISTNLNPYEIGQRYSLQIRSRLEGEYRILPFFGDDIRRLKRERG